jgi:hypothetical protein
MAPLTPQQTLELIALQRQIIWFYQLEDFTDAQLKTLLRSVQQAETEILATIDRYAVSLPDWYEERALSLLDSFSNLTLGLQSILNNGILNLTAVAGMSSFLMQNDILSFGGRVADFNTISLTAEQLRALLQTVPVGGYFLSEWVQNTYTVMIEDIRKEILTGMLKGDSYPEFVSRLTEGFGMSRKEAINISRSYVHTVNNYAMQEVYNGNSDIIKKVRWTATLEVGFVKTGHGVCPRCALLDGSEYGLDEQKPPCPLHINCRCLYLPVLVSWKELGFDMDELEEAYRPTVIREDKAIGAGGRRTIEEVGFNQGNYKDFYLEQSDKFQRDVLGPVRADLLSSGKVKWEDLVDKATGKLKLLRDL